jgi:hypothetical protein
MDRLILKQKLTVHSEMYYNIAERQVNEILSMHILMDVLIDANIFLYILLQSASQ